MHRIAIVAVSAGILLGASGVFAQGTQSMYFIGPFEGEVTIKDYRTPGPPGYYYHPDPSPYPSYARCYDHPVRCSACGYWRDLGKPCMICGARPDRREVQEARRGTVYSPRPIPGQYWYERPMRSVTTVKHGMGWPYLSPRYQTGAH